MIVLNPYLSFDTNTKEVMEFYQSVFGGELEISTFGDTPGVEVEDRFKDLTMHSVLKTDLFQLMAADSAPMGGIGESKANASISLSGSADDESKLTEYFEKLSEGGNMIQPLEKANWGDTFGMFTDKFGTTWLINIAA